MKYGHYANTDNGQGLKRIVFTKYGHQDDGFHEGSYIIIVVIISNAHNKLIYTYIAYIILELIIIAERYMLIELRDRERTIS